jgi:uncharacterized delta-60 repeat protein
MKNNSFASGGSSTRRHCGRIAAVFFLLNWAFQPSFAAQTPGTLDTGFIKGPGADGFVRVVSVQPDGKILAGGNFSTLRGSPSPLVARLNSDGSLDSTFTSPFPTPVLAARIYTLAVLSNGGLLVGGLFTNVGGTLRTNIARLQANGMLDETFNAMAGPSGLVRILVPEPGGKILIGGEFTSVNNTNRNRIARLNADGSLDTSFDPAAGAGDIVRTVALMPGGQVLVGGLFTTFAGVSKTHLARLNNNGSLDPSFPAGSGPNGDVYFASPQPDSTILISGDFTSVNGTGMNRIARLQADGSLDTTFMPDGGALGGPVYHVLSQPNGKIVLGGGFTSVNGTSVNRLARVTGDGSLDPVFTPGSGASDLILSMALQGDGMILAGGLFGIYDSTNVNMIARIYGDPSYPVLAVQNSGSNQILLSWASWAGSFSLQAIPALGSSWQPVTATPVLQGSDLTVTLDHDAGAKFYRLAR